MLKIHKRLQAEQDLINIWIYSFENWGVNQADYYLDQIDDALNFIAANPAVGINIDTVRQGYLKYQVREHFIFYKIKESKINIVRVLGNDMDYFQHL